MSLSEDEPSSSIAIDRTTVQQVIVKLLQRKGMFVAEAEIVAERMIQADLNRCASHGIRSLRSFLDVIDLGEIDPRARIITVSETASTAVVDGGTGMGHVATTRALQMAVNKAHSAGIASVVVRNSRPAGDLAGLACIAANSGLIGLVASSIQDLEDDTQTIGWSVPGPDSTLPMTGHIKRHDLDAVGQMLCTVLTAGLSSADIVGRKRKSVAVANVVEFAMLAIDPSHFGSRDAMLERWRPLWSDATFRNAISASPTETDVRYSEEDARLLAALAAEAKIPATW